MINRKNYLLVKKYLDWKKGSVTEQSVSRIRFYLRHLLLWADDISLGQLEIVNKDSFQGYLSTIKTNKGNMSQESIKKILDYSRDFYRWAKDSNPRDFQAIKPNWIVSLKPKRDWERNMTTEARTVTEHEMFTLVEKFQQSSMVDNIVFKRDFTSAVFLYLSGQRAGAYVTTPINAINLEKNEIYQWPDVYGVKTKCLKKATTFLYQIPGLIEVVRDWDSYIRSIIPEEEWNTYPWCAPFNNRWGEKTLVLQPSEAKRRGSNLIKRFNKLFLNLDLDYKNPHSFRHGHAVYGLMHARTPAEFHAVSQNLIHNNSVITEEIYAVLQLNDRKRIISNLHSSPVCQPDDALLSILKPLSKEDLTKVIHLSADLLSH